MSSKVPALLGSVKSMLHAPRQRIAAILNTHEDYGIANVFRTVAGFYIGLFVVIKLRGKRKARLLEEMKNILNDALARAGLN